MSAVVLYVHPDVTLCEEAVFQSLSSLRLSSVPLERLLESLPGQRVDRKSLERLKKACSPQQQVLQLLRLQHTPISKRPSSISVVSSSYW